MAIISIHGGHNASVSIAYENNNRLIVRTFACERRDRIKFSQGCETYEGDDFSSEIRSKWMDSKAISLDSFIKHALKETGIEEKDISVATITSSTDVRRLPTWILGKSLYMIDHHLAHAASAYYSSGFNESAILVCDGMGDNEDGWDVQSFWRGTGKKIECLHRTKKKNRFEMGIGNTYQLITYLLGFNIGNCGTTMALAKQLPPKNHDSFYTKNNFDVFLNNQYIKLPEELKEYTEKRTSFIDSNYISLLRKTVLPRDYDIAYPNQKMYTARQLQMAADLQQATEDILVSLSSDILENVGTENLCCAGGVFLNCVANTTIREKLRCNLFIPCAPGDDGLSFGSALFCYYSILDGNKKYDYTPFQGASVTVNEDSIFGMNRVYTNDPLGLCCKLIHEGYLVGVIDGYSELGPRALGGRSLLANPSNKEIKKLINERLKGRESFRPFAVAILEEEVWKYYEGPTEIIPYMLEVRKMKECAKPQLEAVLHVDNTSRIQVVSIRTNENLYRLIKRYYEDYGIPALLNTSLNRGGEPIVDNCENAMNLLIKDKLDYVYMNGQIYSKSFADFK